MRDIKDALQRLDQVDSIRKPVLEAVKSEINGHMSATPLLPYLSLGHPQRCVACDTVYMERRQDAAREGFGFCSDYCAEVGKTLPDQIVTSEVQLPTAPSLQPA